MKLLSKRSSRTKLILLIVAILVSIPMIFPLYWIIVNSLKSDAEIFSRVPTFLPSAPAWENYSKQFASPNMISAIRSSFVVSICSMIISLLLSVPAAYGLARFRMKWKKPFIMTFLVTQMLPTSLMLTPLFLIFNKLHLLNNYLSAILSTATISIPFIVLILRPIFASIPRELEEAAAIDGCSGFTAFIRIILPIAKNGTVTSMCFAFVYAWNDLIYSITFNTKDNLRPLTTMVYNFLNLYGTHWNMIMAYGVIMVLPVLIMFIFLQRYIVEGLVAGSVKG
ncbi:MAG: carbohydrate ABC transporter permease [Eubacteriales bacterium]|nr:carbohydrate ABC transporter permease [Eubacteriales bacterium]